MIDRAMEITVTIIIVLAGLLVGAIVVGALTWLAVWIWSRV